MKEKCLLKNDDGSVLVLALIMLMLLTLIGIAASRTASIEIQISGNDIIYKQNLYMAEAGAMEAAQTLENTDLSGTPPPCLPAGIVDPFFAPDADFLNANSQPSSLPNSDLLALYEGLIAGSSLAMSKSNVHSYAIYGRCKQNRGLVVINVGYRKAF